MTYSNSSALKFSFTTNMKKQLMWGYIFFSYRLMFDCWIEDPDDRPMFSDVVDRCARIIESRLTPEVCLLEFPLIYEICPAKFIEISKHPYSVKYTLLRTTLYGRILVASNSIL